MLRRSAMRIVVGLLLGLGLAISACTMSPKPEGFTGQDVHESHQTGMESQVSDH